MSFLLPLLVCIHCNPAGELNILEMFREVLETPGSGKKKNQYEPLSKVKQNDTFSRFWNSAAHLYGIINLHFSEICFFLLGPEYEVIEHSQIAYFLYC